MLPDFIKAKELLKKQQHRFFAHLVDVNLPSYLKQASYKTIYEGDRMSMRYNEEWKYDKEISRIAPESKAGSISDLKTNPDLIYEHMQELAMDFVKKQVEGMISTVTEITDMTGNVVQGRGEITPENIFSILEKIEVSFDASGNPNLPSFFAGPEMVEKIKKAFVGIEKDPLYKKRHEDLIARKKNEWNDRQNSRKLVG